MGKILGILSAIFVTIVGVLSGLLKKQKHKTEKAEAVAEKAKRQNKIDSVAIKKMEEVKEKQDKVEIDTPNIGSDGDNDKGNGEKYEKMVNDWNNGN